MNHIFGPYLVFENNQPRYYICWSMEGEQIKSVYRARYFSQMTYLHWTSAPEYLNIDTPIYFYAYNGNQPSPPDKRAEPRSFCIVFFKNQVYKVIVLEAQICQVQCLRFTETDWYYDPTEEIEVRQPQRQLPNSPNLFVISLQELPKLRLKHFRNKIQRQFLSISLPEAFNQPSKAKSQISNPPIATPIWSNLDQLIETLQKPICQFVQHPPKKQQPWQLYIWPENTDWHYSIKFSSSPLIGQYHPEEDRLIVNALDHIRQNLTNRDRVDITPLLLDTSNPNILLLMSTKYLGLTLNQQMYLVARLTYDDVWPSIEFIQDNEHAKILFMAFNNPESDQPLPEPLQPIYEAFNYFTSPLLLNMEQEERFYSESISSGEWTTREFVSDRAVGGDLFQLIHILVLAALHKLGVASPLRLPECPLDYKNTRIGGALSKTIIDVAQDYEPWERDLLMLFETPLDWESFSSAELKHYSSWLMQFTQQQAQMERVSSMIITLLQEDLNLSFENAQIEMLQRAGQMISKIDCMLLFIYAQEMNSTEFFTQLIDFWSDLAFVMNNLGDIELWRNFLDPNKNELIEWLNADFSVFIAISRCLNLAQQELWISIFSDTELQNYIQDTDNAKDLLIYTHSALTSTLLKKIGPKLSELVKTPEEYHQLLSELPITLYVQFCCFMDNIHINIFQTRQNLIDFISNLQDSAKLWLAALSDKDRLELFYLSRLGDFLKLLSDPIQIQILHFIHDRWEEILKHDISFATLTTPWSMYEHNRFLSHIVELDHHFSSSEFVEISKYFNPRFQAALLQSCSTKLVISTIGELGDWLRGVFNVNQTMFLHIVGPRRLGSIIRNFYSLSIILELLQPDAKTLFFDMMSPHILSCIPTLFALEITLKLIQNNALQRFLVESIITNPTAAAHLFPWMDIRTINIEYRRDMLTLWLDLYQTKQAVSQRPYSSFRYFPPTPQENLQMSAIFWLQHYTVGIAEPFDTLPYGMRQTLMENPSVASNFERVVAFVQQYAPSVTNDEYYYGNHPTTSY